jgi:glutathionyl-hydroquinone reductase
MIHGVNRCGFAKNQRAYDKAIAELCEAFDRADDILQKQRYLTGNDALTDADIRLFVSLIRFDEVYAIYFKANARLVMLTPSLLNFAVRYIKFLVLRNHVKWIKLRPIFLDRMPSGISIP